MRERELTPDDLARIEEAEEVLCRRLELMRKAPSWKHPIGVGLAHKALRALYREYGLPERSVQELLAQWELKQGKVTVH